MSLRVCAPTCLFWTMLPQQFWRNLMPFRDGLQSVVNVKSPVASRESGRTSLSIVASASESYSAFHQKLSLGTVPSSLPHFPLCLCLLLVALRLFFGSDLLGRRGRSRLLANVSDLFSLSVSGQLRPCGPSSSFVQVCSFLANFLNSRRVLAHQLGFRHVRVPCLGSHAPHVFNLNGILVTHCDGGLGLLSYFFSVAVD